MQPSSRSWIAAALFFCELELTAGLPPLTAHAESAGPANGLDHIFRSLEDLRDEARAQAGYHKARWICHRSTMRCEWRKGYWGPPPPPKPPIRIRPIEEWGNDIFDFDDPPD